MQKIAQDRATGLLVAPYWPTQPWWPYLLNMLIDHPICLPRKKHTLWLPAEPQRIHSLHNQLKLVTGHLSGDYCKVHDFHKRLQTSYKDRGDRAQQSSTSLICLGGESTAMQRKLIKFLQL